MTNIEFDIKYSKYTEYNVTKVIENGNVVLYFEGEFLTKFLGLYYKDYSIRYLIDEYINSCAIDMLESNDYDKLNEYYFNKSEI